MDTLGVRRTLKPGPSVGDVASSSRYFWTAGGKRIGVHSLGCGGAGLNVCSLARLRASGLWAESTPPPDWHSFFNSPTKTTAELCYCFDWEKSKNNSDQLYLSAL